MKGDFMDEIRWKPQLKLLNQERIEKLYTAATEILERTGLNVHHEKLRSQLKDAGAKLGDGPRVYIPPVMVEQALRTAKKNVVIYNRLGEPCMPLGPHQIYFGTGSDLINTLDLHTKERRSSLLKDVADSARVCDALDEYDFVMSFALPSDVPNENAEPQQYLAILENTIKPAIMTSFSGQEGLERMHKMACVVSGGEQEFRQKPTFILYGQFVSPLQHDLQALERLIFCAQKEVPLIYVPTIMSSASGPITLAGSLAIATAEQLAGLVMHQTVNPGAPFICGACVSTMDMHTMLFPYGSPEWRLNDLVMAELSRYYKLPVFGTAGASDSKIVDAQTGFEYMGSLLVAAMAGTNLIHDVGYLESGLTGSLESLVAGADAIRWVKQFINGINTTEETLALDVIDEVGPGEQFLTHAHTLKHLREDMWLPLTFDHGNFDAWVADGGQDYTKRARKLAEKILNSHQPQPVDADLKAKLLELSKLN
jgi:trimethylamine--corrinoid protein Co-methyltransferase